MAKRYTCPLLLSVLCDRGNGAPPRKRCAYCKSELRCETGKLGVFLWRPGGRYDESEALSIHATHAAAARASAADPNMVVRWVSE